MRARVTVRVAAKHNREEEGSTQRQDQKTAVEMY